MWAHYANNHKGFAIALDPTLSFFKGSKTIGALSPVRYTEKRPELLIDTMLKNLSPPDPRIFFYKNDEWKYEEEMRMIAQIHLHSDHVIQADPLPIHLFKLPPKCLQGIVFGAHMKLDSQKKIIRAVKENPELAHVGFARVAFNPETYRVALSYIKNARDEC
jgi:hypothetical protein